MATPVTRRVQSADGAVTLAAHDYGGSGPSCLLLHGNGLHGRAYACLVRHLTAAGLRVVALDHRGCGASTLPEGASSACRRQRQPLSMHALLRRGRRPAVDALRGGCACGARCARHAPLPGLRPLPGRRGAAARGCGRCCRPARLLLLLTCCVQRRRGLGRSALSTFSSRWWRRRPPTQPRTLGTCR
jgi:pimeloyl-ACP methyl ester carboxylesterase